jgi:mRNA interferase RelE/StbE
VPNYRLDIKPSAEKELDRLDTVIFDRVDAKVVLLADNPRPIGSKKLKGYRDVWRMRVGDWRIVYSIDDRARIVTILRVGHRRDVYD